MLKDNIRKEILGKLRKQDKIFIQRKSSLIKGELFATAEFKKAKTVMYYVSFNGEVDTLKMIDETLKMGKTVAVPAIFEENRILKSFGIKDRKKDLVEGRFGIPQPKEVHKTEIPPDRLDLVVVPGVAFDSDGKRLGRGMGYYDRFLKSLPDRVATIGVCFDFQKLSSVPVDSHDFPVKKVIAA